MRSAALRILLVFAALGASLNAQNVQPGLEAAVKWKWSVLPSEEKDWGLPLTEPPPAPGAPPTDRSVSAKKDPASQTAPSIAPGDYEVKRGDALAIISRKSGVPVTKLKLFNALTNDTIRIGQILKIPTATELVGERGQLLTLDRLSQMARQGKAWPDRSASNFLGRCIT